MVQWMGDDDIFIVLGATPEEEDKVTSMWVLEYLLLRGADGTAGNGTPHLATRVIDAISKNPKTTPLMLAELCRHPSAQISAQAMSTLVWLSSRSDKGARKKSDALDASVKELGNAPDSKERVEASEAFLRKKGMVIGAEALDKLDIFAMEMFEELLPKRMMLEVRTALASHPETPDGLLRVLEGDPEVGALAGLNIRESEEDVKRAPTEEESMRLRGIYHADFETLAGDFENGRIPEIRRKLHGGLAIYVGMLDVTSTYCGKSIGAKPADAMISAYWALHRRFEGTCGTEELRRRMDRVAEFADGVNPEIRRLHGGLARNAAEVEAAIMDRCRIGDAGNGGGEKLLGPSLRRDARPEKDRV